MSASTNRRELPVVRWLRIGAAAAGVGMALAAAPAAVAWADDSPAASSASDSGARSAAPAHRASSPGASATAAAGNDSPAAETSGRGGAASGRVTAQTNVSRAGSDLADVIRQQVPQSTPAPSAAVAVNPSAATTSAAVKSPAAAVASVTAQPKVTAQKLPSAAPGVGSFGSTVRLNIEDLVSGTGAPKVTAGQEARVVKGLFKEILRRDPTDAELKSYEQRLRMSGVNGVVAGLYNSEAFRVNAITNYYADLLGKMPESGELKSGVTKYTIFSLLGSPESYVASQDLAGGKKFYEYSASGGGPYGAKPDPQSYVNLLYRSLLGAATGPDAAALVQSIQQGKSLTAAANQFVSSDAYRAVKVFQAYAVLGEFTVDPKVVADYVTAWRRDGGQAGISQSLLATQDNVRRIETDKVPYPDVVSADKLRTYMLADYSAFVAGIKEQLQGGPSETDEQGKLYGCKGTKNQDKCNKDFYALLSQGGLARGIPNDTLQTATNFVQVTKLIPTQDEVDMRQSLLYPLRDPDTAGLYLTGGPISAPGGIILTADSGQYVIDGHHRWSALYVMNPYTSIASIDLGYVPDPKAALQETQMAIGAREGYLPFKKAPGTNLFEVPEDVFKQTVFDYIWTKEDPTAPDSLKVRKDDEEEFLPNGKKNPGYQRPIVFNEFTEFLTDKVAIPGVDQGALTPEQAVLYTQPIEDYLWNNVLRMRETNRPIPGATPRDDMPQPLDNAYPPYLQLLEQGNVIYTLPAIASLG